MKPKHELRIYSHRGANLQFPENTIAAFRQALKEGATHLEMDVRITSDGHIVVAHDPNGLRLAGEDMGIAESTLQQIQAWNLGKLFRDRNGRQLTRTEFRIPTLWEVLRVFRGVPLNIDIKDHHPLVVRAVIELVRLCNAEFHVQLCSFDPRVVRWARQMTYRGPLASNCWEIAALKFLPNMLHRFYKFRGDSFQAPLNWRSLRLATRRLIEGSHRLGRRIDFWVVNNPEEALRLLEWGASGLMTDDPAGIAPAVHQFARIRKRPVAAIRLK